MKVLVTGGNGHLGWNLVKLLLEAGHQVRASVRSLADADKTAHVRSLGAVELVAAELDQPAQLRAAMDGVDILFHAAAIYAYFDAGREQEIMDASVKGAESVLRAAADAKVRKVIMTSSVVTVPFTAPGAPPSTEADWTQERRVTYIRAKTEGERLAWRLAGELGLNFTTVLPGSIAGPGFARNTPTLDVLESMMLGGFRLGVPDANLPFVDVRDVARAHLLAAERDAQGRFIAVNDELPSFARIIEVMHGIDPRIGLPLMRMPDFMVHVFPLFDWLNAKTLGSPRVATPDLLASLRGKRWNASNRRARELLGWVPQISLEQSLRDTLAAFRARTAG